jgi:DNA modification methylase
VSEAAPLPFFEGNLVSVHYTDDRVTLYHGDCIEVMRTLPDASVDAVVTDPPYGLSFMGKDWDNGGKMLGQMATRDEQRGAFAYGGSHDRGYADNDSVGFQAFSYAWATEALRVLKPGGHLLAFGGTRTWHRLASAIEDAGFEVRDSIAWMYGSGFPKSHDVSKGIDKLDAKDEQQQRRFKFSEWVQSQGVTAKQIDEATGTFMGNHYTTHPTQPAVMTREHLEQCRHFFADIPRWVELECDKRSVESKNFAMREVVGKYEADMGGLGGERLGQAGGDITAPATSAAQQWQGWGTALKPAHEPIVVARKPLMGTVAANVLTHGTGALNIDGCRIGTKDVTARSCNGLGISSSFDLAASREQRVNGGHTAGRWPANVILDESQAAALDAQSGVTVSGNRKAGDYGLMGYMGADVAPMPDISGDSGGASRFFYTAKANSSERPNVDGVAHPTVKPLDLMRYLVRLVTPPGGTVLEPFAGSGTTAEACIIEGFKCIAIEMTDEYLPLILDRITKPIETVMF